eukprot:1068032_1
MATAHSHIHSSIPSHSNPQSKPAPQPLSNVNKSSVSSTDASSNLNTVDEPSSVPHDSREKTCSATLNTEELQSDKQPTADSSDHKLDDTAHTDSKDTGDATVEHATHKESDDEGYVYDYNEDEKKLKVSYPWKPDQAVPVFYLVTSRITDHCESSFSSFGYKPERLYPPHIPFLAYGVSHHHLYHPHIPPTPPHRPMHSNCRCIVYVSWHH